MTNGEISEAQKLIADMRNVLTDLVGTTDADKLAALVNDKVPRLYDSFYQLVRHRPTIFESVSDYDTVNNGLAVIQAVAEMEKRRYKEAKDHSWFYNWLRAMEDRKKAKLIPTVAKFAPRIGATLDKNAQALWEMRQ